MFIISVSVKNTSFMLFYLTHLTINVIYVKLKTAITVVNNEPIYFFENNFDVE